MAEKIWFKHYPKGVPHEINPEEYSSVIDLLEKSFKDFENLTAFVNMGKGFTYAEIDQKSRDFAAFLQNKTTLKPGDRIVIQMPNLLQYPIAMFGAIRAGLIVVNANPLYTASEMEHQFKDSGAKTIVILSNFAHNLEKIIQKTQIETVIVTNIGDMLGGLKGGIVNFVVKYIKKMVPPYSLPQAISFKETLDKGQQHNYKKPEVKLNDTAFLQYTGGTTGVSKGAELTHRNIIANMEQIFGWMQAKLKVREETVITALPLYHIFALTVNCLAFVKIGARNILITNPRDMKAFCKDLSSYPFTVITGVNTLFNGMLNQESFRKLDFKHLKIAVGGGMAVQPTVAQRWIEVTKVPLAEGYGLTETSPVLSCNPIDGTERNGTIGLPLPNTELALFDDNGNPVPQGERGEIWAKGPQIMKGYWQKEDETKNIFSGEWLKTGDIGLMDEDGFFRIVDRKKEMILVSGFNVYPNEVEAVISSHPKVLEVGVAGVPCDSSTEMVKAFIVKKDESLTEQEVIDFCKEHLTNYKVPKAVVFKTELPKSNVGKILRRLLKKMD